MSLLSNVFQMHTLYYMPMTLPYFLVIKIVFLQNLINDALVRLGKWLFYNKLHLNIAKCHYIICKTSKSNFLTNFNLIFCNESLNRV